MPLEQFSSAACASSGDDAAKPTSANETEKVAVKVLTNINKDHETTRRVWQEISLLYTSQRLQQIIALLDLEIHRNNIVIEQVSEGFERLDLHIVMPYVEHDLAKLIQERRFTSEAQIRSIVAQLLLGLRGLHKANIIHRDLSSRNVLLNSALQAYLCDFGLARFYDPDERMSFGVITQWYRAPEVLLDCKYGPPVDVWAVGVMMAEMFIGRHLFPGRNKDLVDQIDRIIHWIGSVPPEDLNSSSWFDSASQNARHYITTQCRGKKGLGLAQLPFVITPSPEALHLMQALITMNPTKRLTAEEALSHEWFTADEGIRSYIKSELQEVIGPDDAPEANFSEEAKRSLEIDKIKLLVKEFHLTSTSAAPDTSSAPAAGGPEA